MRVRPAGAAVSVRPVIEKSPESDSRFAVNRVRREWSVPDDGDGRVLQQPGSLGKLRGIIAQAERGGELGDGDHYSHTRIRPLPPCRTSTVDPRYEP